MTLNIFPTKSEENWTSIIRPKRGWFDLRLGELRDTWDLILLFVWRDFVSTYRQTVLGPFWFILQPIMGSLIFTVIFGQIAKLPTAGLPNFIFYMSGNVIWGYFSQCFSSTSDSLGANANLYGKVYFPRLTIPIANLISGLITFFVEFCTFLGFMIYFLLSGSDIHPNLGILLLPVLLLILAGLGLGAGLTISSLTYRYRDLKRLVGTGMSLLMYATPVVYTVESVPSYLKPIIQINPVTPVVLTFRYGFLGSGTLEPMGLVYSLVFMIILLFVGIVLFNRAEATFMDTV